VKHRRDYPGQVVTGIPIGGARSGVPAWTGSAQTHVEFVRVVERGLDAITVFEGRTWFEELVRDAELELVVACRDLGRGAVGVALAHGLMLSEQYGLRMPHLVIVCEKEDPALVEACGAHGIEVRTVWPVGLLDGEEVDDER
jgi:hypothetical protein